MSHIQPILHTIRQLWSLTIFLMPALLMPLTQVWAQEDRSPAIFYPSLHPEHQWQLSVGLIQVTPPKELTEEAYVPAPAFDLHALYGLPSHFSLDGRVLSQVLQNHISLGGRWSHPLGRFAVGAGYDIAFWFGWLNVGGFDSKAYGWTGYPSVSVGYNTGDVRLVLKGEVIFDLYHKSMVGKNEVMTDQDRLVGGSVMFAMEQPFWKDIELTLGFRATYTKFHWMTWSLFSTFDRYLFYPEIIIGFIL